MCYGHNFAWTAPATCVARIFADTSRADPLARMALSALASGEFPQGARCPRPRKAGRSSNVPLYLFDNPHRSQNCEDKAKIQLNVWSSITPSKDAFTGSRQTSTTGLNSNSDCSHSCCYCCQRHSRSSRLVRTLLYWSFPSRSAMVLSHV